MNVKKCPSFGICGGCSYNGDEYDRQCQKKQKYEEKLFKDFGKVQPLITMEEPYYYRNKAQVSFGLNEKGKIIYGNYVPSTHTLVAAKDCFLCDQTTNAIFETVKDLSIKYGITVFDERSMKGCLRHCLVRHNSKGEYMVVLVTGTFTMYKAEQFVGDLVKKHSCIKTVIHNFNREFTSMILGKKNTVLYGKGFITETLCGLSFRISAPSFFQVNLIQTEKLYRKAIELAGFKGDETCIDAYCGTGTIGMIFASKVKSVVGVELNASAVRDAQMNAKFNHVNNISFVNDDASRYMMQLSKKKAHIDMVMMDPPRSGSDIRFLKSLVSLSPDRVVYISCGPESLKRDLSFLKKFYHIDTIQPVDMFPYTDHVETVVLLSRA